MIQIANRLYIGTVPEARSHPDWAIVNLTHTWHYELHNWGNRDGVDRSGDPCYVICEEDPHRLSLNWIDSPDPRYFDYGGTGVENFHKIFDYINKNRAFRPVAVVCNRGESRAPSVAMAYLARATTILRIPTQYHKNPEDPFHPIIDVYNNHPKYEDAREQFKNMYPNYYPAQGITTFLIDHWEEL
jgi:hypothetical protein